MGNWSYFTPFITGFWGPPCRITSDFFNSQWTSAIWVRGHTAWRPKHPPLHPNDPSRDWIPEAPKTASTTPSWWGSKNDGTLRIIGPSKLAILRTQPLLCMFKPFHWKLTIHSGQIIIFHQPGFPCFPLFVCPHPAAAKCGHCLRSQRHV